MADGRSPIAVNWIRYWVEAGHEVHLLSTFPCVPDIKLASLNIVPVAFSGLKTLDKAGSHKSRSGLWVWGAQMVKARTALRHWLGPLTLPQGARRLRELANQIRPDLVHAMRIPYEGMLAALADLSTPLIISVWGNDFTLHATATPWMGSYTRLVMRRAAGLHTDCRRDLRLAHEWGYPRHWPAVVLPTGGGVQRDIFYPERERVEVGGGKQGDRVEEILVINPRGFRAYVRNDTFFRAIPLVLEQQPAVRFVCPGMAGEPKIESWLDELGIRPAVTLMAKVRRVEMAGLFRKAQVMVSPTTHDGTPNTLLEAMACGSFPVAGDLESIREWINPGINGLLVDPANPQDLADAILTGLSQPELRRKAREHNLRLIEERAEYGRVMQEAGDFYRQLVVNC